MARPRLVIDPALVTSLAEIHCTYDEISAVVGCSTDTLKRRFADLIEKGRQQGKTSLRRAQFKSALDGNVTMQIWLGKQHLEQTDDRGGKEVAVDPQETARQVREAVRLMDEADGLRAA